MQKTAGFTLIELMIVVLIIGVLASIAMPAYENDVARAEVTEAISIAGGLKPAIAELWWSNGSFAGITSGQNGIPQAASLAGHHVAEVTVKSGSIQAVFKSHGVSPGLAGKTLTFAPTAATYGGSINWTCSSATIAQALLPNICSGV
ncbi:fimbrial protein [mine drainage metagenome]|uniref:Fimbrial protein n=1 Tax=mine drainage metagenome TaxID=410659 RepID=T1BN96_9ZZZZ